jgi:uncharacterized protein YndB with AHSA1/START domain
MNTDEIEVKIELRGETEAVITRYFNAPRPLVFDCFTKPDLMRRWLIGPEGWSLDSCELDLAVGGKYLYVYADSQGSRMGVYGTFTEVLAPEIVANTENFAMDMSAFDPDAPEDPSATVESRVFTEAGKKTLMTHHYRFASPEIRKMVFESGADEGMEACYRELDRILLQMR